MALNQASFLALIRQNCDILNQYILNQIGINPNPNPIGSRAFTILKTI